MLKFIKNAISNHWVQGRQGTGYKRFSILPTKVTQFLGLDMVIIKMDTGIEVPAHFDRVPNRRAVWGYDKHLRLNFILKQPPKGGRFWMKWDANMNNPDIDEPNWQIFYPPNRIYWFAPSHIEHGVTRVEEGTRYVFSIGWCSR